MKWFDRLKEKVHSAQLPLSPRASRAHPEDGESPRFRDTNESEQDFQRAWEDFRSATEEEKEKAMEKVLGLFCKISRRTGNPARLAQTLVDNRRGFAFAIARALVTDIERLRKASPNGQLQPNDILNYFTGVSHEGSSMGGNLLFALEGLVVPPLDVQPLLDAGLLSSLVTVLYRLLCSADSASSSMDNSRSTDDSGDERKRIMVEGGVVHIMKALARHPGAAQTLAECDRLQFMFHMVVMGGTTPLSAQFQKMDASSAPPVHLAQLYRHVLQILELLLASDNGATAQYIQNQELVEELLTPILSFVENTGDASYAVSVVSLIKNAVQLSSRPEAGGISLINNLWKERDYDLFLRLALKLSESGSDLPKGSPDIDSVPPQLMRLLDIIGELALIGTRTSSVHSGSGISGKGGKPPPGGQMNSKSDSSGSVELSLDRKLRDSNSVLVFKNLFLKTESVALRLELLDRLLRLFAENPDNYAFVQNLQIMSLFIQNMGGYPPLLQERVLKVLEVAVVSANCVPEKELLSLCLLIQQPLASSLRTSVLTLFEKLLSFDRQYKKVLREVGVVDLLVDDLKKCEPPVTSVKTSFRSRANPLRANSLSVLALERDNSSPRNQHIFEDGSTTGLAWSCLISLLRKSEGNQMVFRKANGVAAALPLLAAPKHRSNVLKLMHCLISEDTSQAHSEELKCLIEVIHTSSVQSLEGRQWRIELETKEDILWMMWKVIVAKPALKIVFGVARGFMLLLSVLESIQIDDHSGTTSLLFGLDESEVDSCDGTISLSGLKLRMDLFSALVHVVVAAVVDTPANRNLLHECLMSQNFKRLLRCSGLVCEEFGEKIAELLFDLALERVHSPSQNSQGLPILLQKEEAGHEGFRLPGIQGTFVVDSNQALRQEEVNNASAIEVLLFCLLQFTMTLQLRVLLRLKAIASASPRNQDVLSAVGCVGLLLEAIRSMSPNSSSILTCSLQIVEVLGSFRLSTSEIRTLGRYIWQNRDGSGGQIGKNILETVKRMWSIDFVPESLSLSSFIEFRMSRVGHACIRVPLANRTWPPATGYSFACWIRFENLRSHALTASEHNSTGRKLDSSGPTIRIFSVCTAEEKSSTCVELFMDDTGGLKLVTSPTSFLSFKGVHLEECRWYHLVVVHNKPNALAGLFQSSFAYLYLNGRLCHTGKLGYSATPIGKPLQVTIGTTSSEAELCSMSWRLGSCYLYEEVLPAPAVFFMYIMGRAYRGLFQDPNMIRFIPQEACGGGNLAVLESLDIEQQPSSVVQREGSVRAAAGGLAKVEGTGIVWDMEKFANIAQLSGRKLIFAFDGTFLNAHVSTAAVKIVNLVDSTSACASLNGGIPRDAEMFGDIHICTPLNIADNMRKVGGVAVVLAMVEAAESWEMLHLALSLLHSVLKYNPRNARDMQKCHGYHLLALFLHHRMNYFTVDKRCLDLLFEIASCQAAVSVKPLSGVENPAYLQRMMSIQEPVRQISGVPDSITKLVHMDSGMDSGFDVSSNPSKFDDQVSSYDSIFDTAESFGIPESSTGPGISDIGVVDASIGDVDDCRILSNPDIMVHVFLDWTLWSSPKCPLATQLAVMAFIGRLVSTKRYRKHNMTVLRRLNLMHHLLELLQRDVETPVFEAAVEILKLILQDGFVSSELQVVADFVVMTFDPSTLVEGTPIVSREHSKTNQVKVRNMLLDKLIDLQYFLKSDEVKLEEWNRIVSTKVITFLLDEAVHHDSMVRVITLLGLCLATSATFAAKFKSTGGYQHVTRVMPSFFDSPDIYFILFRLVFNQSVYPRQPEVRMLDFHALLPGDGKSGEISFPELLEAVIAMCRAAFNRVSKQSLTAQQSGNFSELASLARSYSDVTEDAGEALQGEALLHKTYAARLMGGEAAAPALITSILRFMVDLAKMCHPFSLACRRMDILESFVDLYFSCARSAGAVQSAQEALAQTQQSEQGEDFAYADDTLHLDVNESDYQKANGLSDHEVKLNKGISGDIAARAFSDFPIETIHNLFYDTNMEVLASSPKYDGQTSGLSSPSTRDVECSPRWGRVDSPTPSHASSSVAIPQAQDIPSSSAGSFYEASNEAFSRLRTFSSFAGPYISLSEAGSSSRHRASTFFSSTPRSDVDSFYSEFGVASSGRFTPRDSSDAIVTPKLLMQLECMRSSGGSCAAGAAAILDLIAEVLADTLTEQVKGMALVEAAIEAVPTFAGLDTMLVFQGLCLGRMINFLERRLLRDEEEHAKKLDKNRWAPNLDTLSWLLVDRMFMGAFSDPGGAIKVLEFLLAMLQLANADGRVEEAVPAGKGLLALARGGGRQLEPYVQALLKNTNRMIMYCLLPSSPSDGFGEDSLSTSFRRSSDSLLRSFDSLRHTAEGGSGESGVSSQEIDKATVLQLILANKKLVFCASNVDAELLCALCWNVTPLLWDPEPSTRNLAVDVWRALVTYRSSALEDILIWRGTQGALNVDVLHNGFNLLLTVGSKAFYEWIEDNYEKVRKVLEQRAAVVWKEYVQGASRFPGVRIKPLEGRRKREMTRRSRDISKIDHSHREQVAKSRSGLAQVRESIAAELRMLRQDKYSWILHSESEWAEQIQQLVHERGLWPMTAANGKPNWQLCATEGPFRMRKKLERQKINQIDIYQTRLEGEDTPGPEYCRRDSLEKEATPPPLSMDHLIIPLSKDFNMAMEEEEYQSKAEGVDDDRDSSYALGQRVDDQRSNSAIQESQIPDRGRSERGSQAGGKEVLESPRDSKDNEPIMDAQNTKVAALEDGEYLIRPFLEPGEKLKFRYNCERVLGLEKRDGIFLIGEQCLYMIDNYFIDEEDGCIKEKGDEGDISVIDKALGVSMVGSNDSQDGMKQSSGSIAESGPISWAGGRAWAYDGGAWGKEKVRAGPNLRRRWRTWKLDSVHELLKRQYQLRPVAIELFSVNGSNDLLVFHKNERDEVFKNLLAQNLPRNSMLDTTISGASKQEGNEGGRLFKILARSFSKRWQNGEISNFQYLMHLNTLAGRGYNDLTQYPVFPWILADYESEELDLSKPETFRCLEKPMGALHPPREESFKTRYENWDDSDIPRFHYGSHYSSAGIVLFYLIRLPPFSWENMKLQGGEFDHADRLFSSLLDTWLSASQGNTADVKELIPEFFYLPEFLENQFNFDLGMTQSGEKVDHVQLPPWAKGSAREFIRKHREALESQYVSENLHHWIDLIFGYKQRGKAAVEATNVFYHLTYEGAVNIDSVTDSAMKAAILAQINHFGQTPRQLFPKPHPKRKWVPRPAVTLVPYSNHTIVPQEIRMMGSRVSQILLYQNTPFIAIKNRVLRPPTYDKYVAWGFPDRSLRLMSYDQDKVLSTHENLHDDGPVTCAGFSRDGQILVTGGEDGVVAVWRFIAPMNNSSPLQLQRALCAHTQAVTCLAVSQSYSLVVSASKDRTIIFWDLTSLEYVRQLPELPTPATSLHINDMSGEVVTAVGLILTVWSINGDCLAAVNTSHAYSDLILSITSPQVPEWTEAGWYITGHQSGMIRLWCMQFDSHSSSNRMTLLRTKCDPLTTPGKAGNKARTSWFTLPASSGIKRMNSGVEVTEDSTKFCITGGTPEYQLTLIKVLTWHKEPVTALCLGNDLKQLCSGDSGGHVVSWTLLDDVSKSPPLLVSQSDTCNSCQIQIMASDTRHHCKNCGQVLCFNCAYSYELPLEDLGHFLPVRICERCYQTRKASQPLATKGTADPEEVVTEGSFLLKSANYNRSESSKF
ncbi:protein SPIRRIG [Physcomitrium patens]|uniref:protein SPIRRIG n=1 Tax=Physcomitrium patens TaxID=3218 RepID=UPI003CCE3FEC